ncbi:MAG: hypothetical protein KatS3mg080_1218 [Anoxybacillus sp.]|nr:MAG: hypothetical protein KatS3mg080_1218 [Anoxybacillus sp.]
MDWLLLADRVLTGEEITDDEALSILNCPDDELLLLLQGAYRIRQTYYGNKVKLNMIMNGKSQDCAPKIVDIVHNLPYLLPRFRHIKW